MRRLPLFLAALTVSSAHADRLIDIPIARKIPIGEFRLEGQLEASRGRTEREYLAAGLTQNIDVELRTERMSPDRRVGTFDVGYNFQPPIVDLSPGLSVGVQDAANTTKDGRRGYACATYRRGLDTSFVNSYVDITLGIRVGKQAYPFVGVNLPFGDRIQLLVEHSGTKINAGLAFKILPTFNVRLIFQEHDTLLSAQVSRRFKS